MTESVKKRKRKADVSEAEQPIPTMPFDEALKRMLATRPEHKAVKKPATKKK